MSVKNLHELGVGEWEGMTFEEIRKKYPLLYQNRGKNPITSRIPGGEAASVCRNRTLRALEDLLKATEGDIAVVAHAGVNRILLCDLLGQSLKYYLTIPQPYGCVNILREEQGRLKVRDIGLRPRPVLDGTLCRELLAAARTPERVVWHCEAVAEKTLDMARELTDHGVKLDHRRLEAAALLHDIARTERDHAAVGARWLELVGYSETAALVARHHDLGGEEAVTEASVLYLADKLIQGDREVTLERRFAESLERISSVEGREVHARRYQQARRVAQSVERQLQVSV